LECATMAVLVGMEWVGSWWYREWSQCATTAVVLVETQLVWTQARAGLVAIITPLLPVLRPHSSFFIYSIVAPLLPVSRPHWCTFYVFYHRTFASRLAPP
jgi:hypothetical protein